MGFDVYGMNPTVADGTVKPTRTTIKGFGRLSADEKKERMKAIEEYQEKNVGAYFRNNVWWWRPLWDYIQDRLKWNANAGHYNDGFEVEEEQALRIAATIREDSKSGYLRSYEEYHKRNQEGEKFDYPFSVENALAFAKFCEQSGGFRIC